jgi:SnoaL-like polyketide cyclase
MRLLSGDRVIVRGEASGTPVATFLGTPPAGASFRIMSIDIHTIDGGKITRSYHVQDWMGAMRQLSGQRRNGDSDERVALGRCGHLARQNSFRG